MHDINPLMFLQPCFKWDGYLSSPKKKLKHLKLAYFSSYLNKMKETIKSNAIKQKKSDN
jgi:hypothetical protein